MTAFPARLSTDHFTSPPDVVAVRTRCGLRHAVLTRPAPSHRFAAS
jgi:hypothetical protein